MTIEFFAGCGWLTFCLLALAARFLFCRFEAKYSLQVYLVLTSLLGASTLVLSVLYHYFHQEWPPWFVPWLTFWGPISVAVSFLAPRRYCWVPYTYVSALALAFHCAIYGYSAIVLEVTFGVSLCLFSLWTYYRTRAGVPVLSISSSFRTLASIGLSMAALLAVLGAVVGSSGL
jgi:hypothetical protein